MDDTTDDARELLQDICDEISATIAHADAPEGGMSVGFTGRIHPKSVVPSVLHLLRSWHAKATAVLAGTAAEAATEYPADRGASLLLGAAREVRASLGAMEREEDRPLTDDECDRLTAAHLKMFTIIDGIDAAAKRRPSHAD